MLAGISYTLRGHRGGSLDSMRGMRSGLLVVVTPYDKDLARMNDKPQANQKLPPTLGIESRSLGNEPQPLTIRSFLTHSFLTF